MKFSKYILTTFLFSISYTSIFSQNLIPNPSFEDANVCKVYQEDCSPKGWRSTLLKAFLYSEYFPSERNELATRPPDGLRYVGLRMFNRGRKFDRSFIQTPLLCQLEKGKKYRLRFQYMSKTFSLNHFEILFVDTLHFHKKNEFVLEKTPHLVFEMKPKIQPNEWATAEAIYEANGNEIGFILGNMSNDENTVIALLNKKDKVGKTRNRMYIFFDDFSLTPLENENLDCDLEKNQQYIYKDSIRHLIHHPIQTVDQIPEPPPPPKAASEPEFEKTERPPPPILEEEISTENTFTLNDILFKTNSGELLPVAFNALEKLVHFLEKNPNYHIQITGHTDNIGSDAANLSLSKKRAKSVSNFLITNGIHIQRIQYSGKGETQPIAENDTEKGRQKNRRVEFELIKKE